MPWRKAAHEYLVSLFLRSPQFHRMVRQLNGTHKGAPLPGSSRQDIRRLKRKLFWAFFKEEMSFEVFPKKHKK